MRSEHTFDTHSLVKRLEKAGLKEKQAEEIVHAISESRNFDLNNIATKTDVTSVKQDIAHLEEKLIHKIENAVTASQNNILKWMIPFMMTIIGLIVSLMFQGK